MATSQSACALLADSGSSIMGSSRFSGRIPALGNIRRNTKLDFGFSEEQEMLRDAAKRFLADNCPTTYVRKMMAHETAHDAGFYKKLVELGWPGLLIPEEYGGTGGTFLDLTVI